MVTIAEVLKQAGYRTALSGKWHLGSSKPRRPSDRGFDEYYGLLGRLLQLFRSFDARSEIQRRPGAGLRQERPADHRVPRRLLHHRRLHRFRSRLCGARDQGRQPPAVLLARVLHGSALSAARQAGGHQKVSGQISGRLGEDPPGTAPAANGDGPDRSRNGNSPNRAAKSKPGKRPRTKIGKTCGWPCMRR